MLQEIYEFQHLTFQEYLTSLAIVNKYYPNAKRNDNIVDILADPKGINAFYACAKKEEIVLLTAALSGWNAEDVAIALINEMDTSSSVINHFYELARLAIMLVLDETELETETVKNLLYIAMSKTKEILLEFSTQLFSTKYDLIAKTMICQNMANWILDDSSMIISLITYIDINNVIGVELVKQMKRVLISDAMRYEKLSKEILKYLIIRQKYLKVDATYCLIASLFTINEEKSDLIAQLLATKYFNVVKEVINTTADLIFDDELLSESMIRLFCVNNSFSEKVILQMKEMYLKDQSKYNYFSVLFLDIMNERNINEIDISEENLNELFIVSLKTITKNKASVIIELFDSPYSSILEKLAEDEFVKWINGTNQMTRFIHNLALLKGLSEDEVFAFYAKHKSGEERDIIEAIEIVSIYIWLYGLENNLSKFKEYLGFVFECLEDSSTSINYAAINALPFTIYKPLSIDESRKIINTQNRIILNKPLETSTFHLFTYMPITKELKENIQIVAPFKQFIHDTLLNDSPLEMKKDVLISAILLQQMNSSEVIKIVEKNEFNNEQKNKINECIQCIYNT